MFRHDHGMIMTRSWHGSHVFPTWELLFCGRKTAVAFSFWFFVFTLNCYCCFYCEKPWIDTSRETNQTAAWTKFINQFWEKSSLIFISAYCANQLFYGKKLTWYRFKIIYHLYVVYQNPTFMFVPEKKINGGIEQKQPSGVQAQVWKLETFSWNCFQRLQKCHWNLMKKPSDLLRSEKTLEYSE